MLLIIYSQLFKRKVNKITLNNKINNKLKKKLFYKKYIIQEFYKKMIRRDPNLI